MKFIRRIIRNEDGGAEDLPGYTLLTLIAIGCIGIIALFGRFTMADNTVHAAAYAAARDASLSRAGDAVPHAISAAQLALRDNVNCASLNVTISGNGLTTGLGEAGTVSATVVCTITASELVFPGWNGIQTTFTVTKTAFSPVDPYRER